ncbi:MAG: SDR family oxidoreductase, partial [Lentisphaeria bacterium]|nr:SDR family oxidoreductase [Lentisphaeria bacterium]
DKPEQQHAFVDAEEKMAELEKIEPLANKVDMAKEIHNLINSLPSYKNAAQSVEDAKKDYQHALENLKLADACARDYIGRHFSNPDAVWYGNSKGLTDYDSRGGISGWALQAYSAAKAGVIGLSRDTAAYLGPYGIRCNAISPGGFERNQPKHFIEDYSDLTMLRRMGQPGNIGNTVVFLASPAAEYITGQNLVVDGGFTEIK